MTDQYGNLWNFQTNPVARNMSMPAQSLGYGYGHIEEHWELYEGTQRKRDTP